AQKGITQTITDLIDKIKSHKNLFVALNKVDAIAKTTLLPMVAEISNMADFKEIFMISALKNDGVAQMLKSLSDVMPESPYLFDNKDAVDVPDMLYLSELTREKIYKYIHKELPYHINVVTEKVETDDEGVLEIYQKIVVKNEGHKKIVVGHGGEQLKRIGTEARHDVQDQWGVNARLHLFVRVEENWEDVAENYTDQGLEFK
nr:GTPase Era [Candidatus Enterousia merdequi]